MSSLKALVAAFRANGWIDNNGIANSLTKKLEHGNLQAFLNEVKAQNGKHINAEAAGYLLRDAQLLLNILRKIRDVKEREHDIFHHNRLGSYETGV
ncbi:hypothetical protein Back11_15490 [Paenibacillus baekrokdamisoli]|uniref:Uncharacterized protein n=1 Tax=Paenibacillus baekrokdamisoli TaxID=1712516 RepID=A0A3G9JAA2_9BACL|nr:hypothetical protein Back11_15490 [Paenibacillus baekrokdamisoli]